MFFEPPHVTVAGPTYHSAALRGWYPTPLRFGDGIPLRDQWSDYYADMSHAEIEQDFLAEASRDRLPVRLIAFESSELVGTVVLRKQGSETLPEFQPELGGLFVVESHRGHGIGTELVRAGMNLALDQGYQTVYATTVVAAGILERLGWEFIKTVTYSDGQFALYRCKL